jgi:hypothetical protein
MKGVLFTMSTAALAMTMISGPALPQAAGNRDANPGGAGGPAASRKYPVGYGPTNAASEQVVSEQPNLLVSTYQFIEAKIMTSVPTVTYVAVFGLNQEASKVEDANRRLQEGAEGRVDERHGEQHRDAQRDDEPDPPFPLWIHGRGLSQSLPITRPSR